MNLQEFLAMGGHGFYVWSSFGVVAVVMIANIIQPRLAERRLREEIRNRVEKQG